MGFMSVKGLDYRSDFRIFGSKVLIFLLEPPLEHNQTLGFFLKKIELKVEPYVLPCFKQV
jgi:hypothetical protein